MAPSFDSAVKRLDPKHLESGRTHDADDTRTMLEGLKNVMTHQCATERWSTAAIRCIREMKVSDRLTQCSALLTQTQKKSLADDAVREWRAHPPSVKDPAIATRDPELEMTMAYAVEITIMNRLRVKVPAWRLMESAVASDIQARYHPNNASTPPPTSSDAASAKPCDPSGPASATVSFGEPTIKRGRLAKAEVLCELRSKVGLFEDCYDERLRLDPKMTGSIDVDFTTHETGNVMLAIASKSTGIDRELEHCVTNAINYQLHFRPVYESVSIRITFHPGAAGV